MLTGSCLCGSIQYELNAEIDTIIHCHCSRCRKESGTAFNSAAAINKQDITLTKGSNLLKDFTENGVHRHFCSNCGSKIFTSRDSQKDTYRLRLGTLDNDLYPQKRVHIYTGSKANWDIICDDYPQFTEMIK